MKKHIFGLVAVWLVLSACTSMGHFTMGTDKVAEFNLSGSTAKLRLTTNGNRVFMTPDSDCVNESHSELIADSNQLLSSKALASKEFITHDLGVKGLSVDQLERYDLDIFSYISKDIEVNAGKPLTIFIPKDVFQTSVDNSSEYELGLSFTPEAKHQYQLIIEQVPSFHTIARGIAYIYRIDLWDVTGDTQIPVHYNRFIRKFKACQKTSESV